MIRGGCICVVVFVLLSPVSMLVSARTVEDFDPLVNIVVFVDILEIRALSTIDVGSAPDFFVMAFINGQEFRSPTWLNMTEVAPGPWTCSLDVPDDQALVNVTLSLWDASPDGDRICDISGSPGPAPDASMLYLQYDIRTGKWNGSDSIGDPSGYGRANGWDDGNGSERDCELFFRVRQTDFDGDGIPYWAEVHLVGTDPTQNDSSLDPDRDGVPTAWEYAWGYDPFIWDDHEHLDPDGDGLSNALEYRMAPWRADPFRRDVFVEVDTMQTGPAGENSSIPSGAFELVRTPYAIHNIVLQFDRGSMGGGGDILPFQNTTDRVDMKHLYETYFLHGNFSTWRRSVFRWCALVNHHPAIGVAFVGERAFLNAWHSKGSNCFELSRYQVSQRCANQSAAGVNFTCASVVMHELGHTFGRDRLFPFGCDSILAYYPHTIAHFLCKNYKSCLNYEYIYKILDYSDGSHGFGDHDDWGSLDFRFFLPPA